MKNVLSFYSKDFYYCIFIFYILAEDIISTSNETDTRKLRARRPNPKYSKEQFEIE
jgi:hypothetical protein